MKILISLILSLSFTTGWSKVIDHSVTLKKIEIFSLKEACLALGYGDLLIADKKDRSHLDCMGSYEKVTSFCEKKFPKDPTLTRGYIDDTSGQVICEKGQNVILKVACDKRDLILCKNPHKGCEKLKKIFAIRHEILRATLVKFLTGKALNCYFTAVEDDKKTLQNLKDELQ